MKRLFVAMSLSMSIWACGGGSPTTPTAAPSPAPASPFAVVTGNYELTIEIDDKCRKLHRLCECVATTPRSKIEGGTFFR